MFTLRDNEQLRDTVVDAFRYEIFAQRGDRSNRFTVYAPNLLIERGETRYHAVVGAIERFAASRLQADPGGIEGTVTDTEGKPIAGMRVSIVSGTTPFPEIAVETNEDGFYRIGSVPPGTFEVGVHDRAGNRVAQQRVTVRSGAPSTLNFAIPVQTDEQFLVADLPITGISIEILESFPLQIHVTVKGFLRDGCTTLHETKQERDGNTIRIHITTKRPKDAFCIQVITEIEERIPIEGGFLPGSYKLIVNDVEKEFEI